VADALLLLALREQVAPCVGSDGCHRGACSGTPLGQTDDPGLGADRLRGSVTPMPLSWTDTWELPGQWTPAPDPDAARTMCPESGEQPQASAAGDEAEQEPDVETTPEPGGSGHAAPAFPSPWPAYGTVHFSPEDGLRMRAFGPAGDPFAAQQTTFALWGETLNGTPCSLLSAHVNLDAGTVGAHGSREVVGAVFARGAHLLDLEDLTIDRVRLRFTGLREFLWHPYFGPVGLEEREQRDTGEAILERRVEVPGARLSFRLAWEGPVAVHERARTRPGEVEVVLDEPATFEAWMRDWVRPLRDLLVFAMREPSRPEAFVASFEGPGEPLWWKPNAAVGPETHEVEFVQRESLLLLGGARWKFTKLLFSLGELGADADRVLGEWLKMHRRLEPTAGFLFAALNTRLHLENALLNLTSAAEGYHRAFHDEQRLAPERHAELTAAMLEHCETRPEREVYSSRIEHANEPSQRRRLTLLYRRASAVIPQRRPAIDAHVTQLIETRNYFVHQDVRNEDVREGDALSLLLQRLVMVLQANIMLDLGWPDEAAAVLLRRSYDGQRVLSIADDEASYGVCGPANAAPPTAATQRP
jgi:ApeA N-terminal domain 1